jgi:hypothetical protein
MGLACLVNPTPERGLMLQTSMQAPPCMLCVCTHSAQGGWASQPSSFAATGELCGYGKGMHHFVLHFCTAGRLFVSAWHVSTVCAIAVCRNVICPQCMVYAEKILTPPVSPLGIGVYLLFTCSLQAHTCPSCSRRFSARGHGALSLGAALWDGVAACWLY